MTFSMLPDGLKFIAFFLYFSSLIFSIFLLLYSIQQKNLFCILISIFIAILFCVFVESMFELYSRDIENGTYLLGSFPLYGFLLIYLISSLIIVLVVYYLMKHRLNYITDISIKNAIDVLPVGVLYYKKNGKHLLSNPKMNDIIFDIIGKKSFNSNKLYDIIFNNKNIFNLNNNYSIVEFSSTPIIKLSNNQYYSFKRNIITIDNYSIYEIIAEDVTELFVAIDIVNKKNKELESIKKKLTTLGENIQEVTIQKEILNAKIHIHDNLGYLSIVSAKYLKGENIDKDSIIRLWMDNLRAFGGPSNNESDYSGILKTANDVGVEVVINGTIPKNDCYTEIIITAIHECLTNTIRHANGDKLFIDVIEDDNNYIINFYNNGLLPNIDSFEEKGGLKYLRSIVESNGYIMIIEINPRFKLSLILKK